MAVLSRTTVVDLNKTCAILRRAGLPRDAGFLVSFDLFARPRRL